MTINDLKKIKIPDSAGVYFFEKGMRVLYVGKATSLRSRSRSYFGKGLEEARGQLIQKMVEEADSVNFIKTDSVLEALIMEANLIKKFQPRYNTKEKDDKSFNYVLITKENYPRVLIARGRELDFKLKSYKLQAKYGPYPHGGIFKEAMKIIRKLFPFRDTCSPCVVPRGSASNLRESAGCKPCFNKQIGLCPGVCSGDVSKAEYGRTINHIKLFFEGKKSFLIKTLEAEMKEYAKKKKFEKAGEIKRTIFALNHIQDVALIKPEKGYPFRKGLPFSGSFRIEAYDVAHTSCTNTVGVMTVIENGEVKKADYRKFNISDEAAGNDIGSLKEMLERRLKHDEWPSPRLIVVDGGKAQYNTARKALDKYGYKIAIAAVVKDEKHKPREIIADERVRAKYEKEILLANSEAHRFALSFHRSKRSFLATKRSGVER